MNDAEQISHLKGFSPVTIKEKFNLKITFYLKYKKNFFKTYYWQKHANSAPLFDVMAGLSDILGFPTI